jgi:hypothetical protein
MRKGNIFIAVLALAITAIAWSCSTSTGGNSLKDNTDSLLAKLTSYNGKLPVNFDNGDVLDSVYYDSGGNRAVFNYIVNNDELTIETLIDDPKSAHDHVVNNIATSSEALAMFKELANNEVEVRTVLLSTRSHQNTAVDLTADEIKAIKEKKSVAATQAQSDTASIKRDSLDILVDSINALCPDSIDRKTELTRVQIENNYLVYNYVYEESKGSTIDKMAREIKGKKDGTDSKYRRPTPELRQLINLCIDNGLGIKHRYVGKSTKQTEDYAFSAVELSKITNHPLPEGYEAIKDRTKPNKLKKALQSAESYI